MTRLKTLTLAALAAAGLAAGVATEASAAIVCNGAGVCWHVRGRVPHYRREFGLVVHPDRWRWGPSERYEWREHRGRGYWRDNAWVRF